MNNNISLKYTEKKSLGISEAFIAFISALYLGAEYAAYVIGYSISALGAVFKSKEASLQLYDFIHNKGTIYPEFIDDKNKLINSADYLNFVILNKDQYEELMKSGIGCDVKLDSLIMGNAKLSTADDLKVYSLEDAAVIVDEVTGLISSATIKLDLPEVVAGKKYYIFAFYYTIDTSNKSTEYVFTSTNPTTGVKTNTLKTMAELKLLYKDYETYDEIIAFAIISS